MCEQVPMVSIIVPMYNERNTIDACLRSFARQRWPLQRLELIVVDGGSTDGSRELVDEWVRNHNWVRLVENPDRKAAAAFNRGVSAATGEVICLFSAHGEADPSYVEASVRALRDSGAAGVGGRYLNEGTEPVSRAIGLAMMSPFGMASPHRYAQRRMEVDTISHPAYRSEALAEVGPFDETLERNSDYDLNFRVRQRGMRLVFDPSIVSVYRPRRSLTALARQFWWYGRWKARVVERHPRSLRPRHLAPPAFVVGAVASAPIARHPLGRRVVLTAYGSYVALLACAALRAKPWRHNASTVAFVVALPVMHFSWGAGFVRSLLGDLVRGQRR
ncbi:MAG: glycosyltransferase family 2 protein [Acidimicrobiales bacterium]|nr:glycosyltransferase family 2 protein [Acidimicrobiales bacterium]